MTDTSRIGAQQRADEIRIFRKELDRLESEGVLLLLGGDKRRQDADISQAVEHWKDWQRRQA